ncbi:ATP-binding SpoIIE family protein phosphatase [Methylocystis rosea]|uniref:ATP-binding SpoIIE family protein phosphatase n=1 Tax=Methylocystis rosea TaxID=173366 RepID=UPI00036B3E7F|nr:ATP-binding SpoIIE family protein phosphatase [Methylocystis rosea]
MLLPVDDPSRVAEVRRAATQLALSQDFPEEAVGRIAIVATELATNILKHAGKGEFSINLFDDADGQGVELMALDRGPGLVDVAKCLGDGYSTFGSRGSGLGAAQRLSSVFGIYSKPSMGAAVLARFRRNGAASKTQFVTGSVVVTCPGESICGDAWTATENGGKIDVLVVDGTGHGPFASEAGARALSTFSSCKNQTVAQHVERIHQGLRPTRGAAVGLARLTVASGQVEFCGVGNISGAIIGAAEARSLVSYNGMAGNGTPTIRTFQYSLAPGGVIILHSDGLSARWNVAQYPGLFGAHPALIAGVLARDYRRGRDDATVVVLRALG